MKHIINILKSKNLVIPEILIMNYKKLELKEIELLIIIYLINNDSTFNPKAISDYLSLTLTDTLEIINNLSEKGLIKLELKKKGNIREEQINLEGLYNKLAFIIMDNNVEKKQSTIFDKFEKEFGRTLSPIEYELINSWLENNNEQIITLALKEAVYNGVSNLRYIDKIIHEWQKKGIKSEKDLINQKRKPKSSVKIDTFDYDWLNEHN